MTQFKKRGVRFFPRFLKHAVLIKPTVDSGGVSRGRSVAVAVGCWLFALQRHFNCTSTTLPRHFHGTFTTLSRHLYGTSTKKKKEETKMYRCFYPHWSRESVFYPKVPWYGMVWYVKQIVSIWFKMCTQLTLLLPMFE